MREFSVAFVSTTQGRQELTIAKGKDKPSKQSDRAGRIRPEIAVANHIGYLVKSPLRKAFLTDRDLGGLGRGGRFGEIRVRSVKQMDQSRGAIISSKIAILSRATGSRPPFEQSEEWFRLSS